MRYEVINFVDGRQKRRESVSLISPVAGGYQRLLLMAFLMLALHSVFGFRLATVRSLADAAAAVMSSSFTLSDFSPQKSPAGERVPRLRAEAGNMTVAVQTLPEALFGCEINFLLETFYSTAGASLGLVSCPPAPSGLASPQVELLIIETAASIRESAHPVLQC
jgi:hypothetical protein